MKPTRMLITVAGSRSAPQSDRYPATPMSIDTRVKTTQNTICEFAINKMQTIIIAIIAVPRELRVVDFNSSILSLKKLFS